MGKKDEMIQHESEYADLLNSLCDMQDAMAYAVRRPVLIAAEQAIVKLETSLIATQKTVTSLRASLADCTAELKAARRAEKLLALRGEPVAICEAIAKEEWAKFTTETDPEFGDSYRHGRASGAQACAQAIKNAAPISGERVREALEQCLLAMHSGDPQIFAQASKAAKEALALPLAAQPEKET